MKLEKKIKSDIKEINRIVEKNRKNKELGEAVIKSIETDVKEHTDNFNRYHELNKKGNAIRGCSFRCAVTICHGGWG